MPAAIPYPNIDPIIFEIGPLAVRWYGLAYVAGLLIGIWYLGRLAAQAPVFMQKKDADDFMVWALLGIILGGRLGYILFYQLDTYIANPVAILQIWAGGMSFHGGLAGVVIAGLLFTRRREISPLRFADALACVSPIGLFFGRLANFINSELWGRETDVPWAMVFPNGGGNPRHPSQLYEAALEGIVLFIVVNLAWRNEKLRARPGLTTGVFITGYALARSFVEFFRQPDGYVGILTIGQALSLPMLLAGLFLIFRAKPVR